jgi:thiol-disulfide isomerase/thioredoxin
MKVNRLSKNALFRILQGKVEEKATCVIKFYSNNCHYCHALHDTYTEMSNDFEDVHFFAFNVRDHPQVEKIFGFTGVPTICMVKTGGRTLHREVMKEPKKPDKKTWYPVDEIRAFIASGK